MFLTVCNLYLFQRLYFLCLIEPGSTSALKENFTHHTKSFFMRYKKQAMIIFGFVAVIAISQCTKVNRSEAADSDLSKDYLYDHDKNLVAQGKEIFRYD